MTRQYVGGFPVGTDVHHLIPGHAYNKRGVVFERMHSFGHPDRTDSR
jgi:hypothetical protein